MIDEDLTNIIIQVLVDSKKPLKLAELLAEVACSKGEVLGVLKKLDDLEILVKTPISETNLTNFFYSLNSEINALHVTKCSTYGIDLYSFGSFFKINQKEKKRALSLSSQVDKVKQISADKRKPLIKKNKLLSHLHIDDISGHLLLIYEASNNYLLEYLEQLAQNDQELKDLLSLHEQSELSLKHYLESNNKI